MHTCCTLVLQAIIFCRVNMVCVLLEWLLYFSSLTVIVHAAKVLCGILAARMSLAFEVKQNSLLYLSALKPDSYICMVECMLSSTKKQTLYLYQCVK